MDAPRIGMFRVLVNLIRYKKGEHGGSPDREVAKAEIIRHDVFATDFAYQDKCHVEFFEDHVAGFEYYDLEDSLEKLGEGIYELYGDFHHHGGLDYFGDYDEEWYVENVNVRALSADDIKAICPEEYHELAKTEAAATADAVFNIDPADAFTGIRKGPVC